MAEKQECDNCRFASKENLDPYDNYAKCHRHAPQVFDGVGTSWPIVFVGDWCGDWEARHG